MHLLQVKNLSGGYHAKKNVIHDISLNIEQNYFLGIVGPNGCGKSTMLKLITRVLTPHTGNSLLRGINIKEIPLKELYRKIAVVSQNTSLYFPISVHDFVLMGRIPFLNRLAPVTQEDLDITLEALTITETLSLQNKDATRLSSGERQRVFIAKALAQKPSILFLDEPTAHLDIGHQIQIMDLLRKLNQEQNLTIVAILHDLNLASEYCNRIALLHEGKLFTQGTPEQVFTYQNIEAVYKTIAVVKENPINRKPYVILVSGKKYDD